MKRMEAREHWTLFRSNEVPDLHDALRRKPSSSATANYERLADEGKISVAPSPPSISGKRCSRCSSRPATHGSPSRTPATSARPQDHCGVIHSSQPLHRDHPQHHRRGNRRLQSRLRRPRYPHHARRLARSRNATRNHHRRRPRARQRHRHQLLPDRSRQDAPTPATAPSASASWACRTPSTRSDLAFAVRAAVEFNDEFMEAVAYYAYSASSDLAAERRHLLQLRGLQMGPRPASAGHRRSPRKRTRLQDRRPPRRHEWTGSVVREKIAKHGMRNSNVLAIAPTATISNIMGTTPCIEPNYKNLYVKSNLSGDFIVLNSELVNDLKKAGLWNQEMLDQLKYFDGELERHRRHPGAPQAQAQDRLRHRLRIHHRRRRPPPEVDRPIPDRSTSSSPRPT